MNENKTNINWYPGHMAKTKREIKEKIKQIDIVLHVIDARVPYSSYIKDINEFILDKEQIIVMTKYDLCDKDKTDKWIKYYESKGYKVICVDINNNSSYKKIISTIEELMETVNFKRKNKGLLPKKAKVMVVGVSNVGKSTLINHLVNKKITIVGNKPGVTKNLSTIKINDKVDLVDTPGVLWPKFESEEVALNLASMTIIKEEVVPVDDVAVHILNKLSSDYPHILKDNLGIDCFDIDNYEEDYTNISKFKNIPIRGGEPDYDRINLLIINFIKNETIKGITFDNIE